MSDKIDKTVRSNKSKGIVAVSKKDSYLIKLKALSKYLITRNEKLLETIIDDKSEGSKLKYRSMSQLINRPKLMHYINKHMNDKFLFLKCTDEEWLYSISQICKMYGINDQNMLYFSKYQSDESEDFYKTIKQYYKELGKPTPSNSEVQALYLLYKKNIITDTILEEMKDIIEGKDRKTKSEKQIQEIIKPNAFAKLQSSTTTTIEKTFDQLSPTIQEFSNSIKNYIVGRNACKNCALHSKGPVILDTNLNSPGPVDIAFISLSPGKDEITTGIPFSGKPGKILRKYIDPIIQKYSLSYVMTNCILCWTNNEQEISNPNMIANACKDLINEILKHFPPKLIVIIGDKAMKQMGVKGGITKLNGELVDGYFILIHPNSIIYNATVNLPKFEKAINQLEQLVSTIDNKSSSQNNLSNVPIEELNIDSNKIIKRFDTDLTLFDIRLLDERILYILKDKQGRKKYLIENVQFPVFIKSGKYKDCKLIDSGMEAVSYLTNSERSDLNKTLYHNLKSMIK